MSKASNSNHKIYFLFWILGFVFIGCNPSKKLQPNQYIVNRVEIKDYKNTNLLLENLEAFNRQKPNRKLFRMFHFFVWWYNLFDENKLREKRIKRNQKYDKHNSEKVIRYEQKNAKRLRNGKQPKDPHLKDKEDPLFIESIRDIGEPAVVLDSNLVEQTRLQLSKYLFIKGYFNNEVRDTILLNAKTKKATVKYMLIPKIGFTIDKITYQIDDTLLKPMILKDSANCLIKSGNNYDKEIFQNERQRITDFALNNGYYFFENAYSDFTIDSSKSQNKLNVLIHIKKFSKQSANNSDSLVLTNHSQYKLKNVFVITNQVIGKGRDAYFKDTIYDKKYKLTFLYNIKIPFKLSLLGDNIDLHSDQLFKRDSAQITYKQLLSLGVFKNVTIQFFPISNSNYIDCYIECTPLVRQSITSELEGTNTSGNMGIDGSVLFQNKNAFKGGELVELKLEGSLLAQAQFKNSAEDDKNLNWFSRTFNTKQIGPELTFAVPRTLFPFSLLPFRRDMTPRTYIKSSINYQARPQFNRTITSIDYGFRYFSHNNTIKHDLIPLEVYLVKATLSNAFRDSLSTYNDAFLFNSFQNHITTLSKYSVTFLSKENSNTSNKPVNYFRLTLQSSGNILRRFFELTSKNKDSLNRYLIAGIPFAQFVKVDADYRHYVPIRKKSRIALRLAGGIGKPLTNLNVLPYEQSFFSGGPNSVRAWRARTLGPGGYDPSNSKTKFDKIGDILLEGNLEYRFHIIQSFNGALFVDAGNIWRLQPDVGKPLGEVVLSKIADQIAIGSGFGIRWDLNFFVIRLDLAIPIKDPKLEVGKRWTFDKQPWQYLVANFGIGYPF